MLSNPNKKLPWHIRDLVEEMNKRGKEYINSVQVTVHKSKGNWIVKLSNGIYIYSEVELDILDDELYPYLFGVMMGLDATNRAIEAQKDILFNKWKQEKENR